MKPILKYKQLSIALILGLSINLTAKEYVISAIVRAPYICPQNSPQNGYIVDILNHIFEDNGHRMNFKYIPWTRALLTAKSGHIDGLAGVFLRNTPTFIIPNQSLGQSKMSFFALEKTNWKFEGYLSLRERNLIVLSDISYGPLDSYIKRYTAKGSGITPLHGTNILERQYKLLTLSRGDLIIEDESVIRYQLVKKPMLSNLKNLGTLTTENIYISFPPQNKDSLYLKQMINAGLTKARKDGTLEQILEKYNLTDWE